MREAVPHQRVLLLAPCGQDAALTQVLLTGLDIACQICRDGEELLVEAGRGVGCVILVEEVLDSEFRENLVQSLRQQQAWSDLPILVLTRPGADSPVASLAQQVLGNVALLERPVRTSALASAVRAALRARGRQYELRDRLSDQARLAAIVSSSDDAIISKTLEGIILTWNAGAERIFGYTAEEIIGQSITILIPPERLSEEQMILQRMGAGERVESFDTVRRTRSGQEIHVSLTVSPIRDSAGRVIGASKVARDITRQKQTEQALRVADRRKDEFLATLAHELRNPLAPIRNSLQILRMGRRDDPTIEGVRSMMERQVNHMVRLVDDLMEVSRISRGKIELRHERVELATVIGSAVEASQPLMDASGHRLSVSLPDERVVLHADPIRLAQIFGNLLNNAAKYTEPGGRIDLQAGVENGQLRVAIQDSGTGIDAEMMQRIFEMFAQATPTHGRSQGGLGLGLWLVKSLVQMHGGIVSAHSDGPGKGSTFVVKLPISNPASAKAALPVDAVPSLQSWRILVVDDNEDAAQTLGTLLECHGSEVHVVHNGRAALAALDAFRPSVVLLDIGMPDMDGHEVARRIRAHPVHGDLRLVALSGWGQDEDRRRSAQAGFNHHLIKPVDLNTLRTVLQSACVD